MLTIADILTIKYPNDVTNGNIILQDDGNGVYIKEWNIVDPMPDQVTLNQWAVEVDLKHRQKLAVAQRKYPTAPEQFDLLYHDLKNGTSNWVELVDQIRAATPEPTK